MDKCEKCKTKVNVRLLSIEGSLGKATLGIMCAYHIREFLIKNKLIMEFNQHTNDFKDTVNNPRKQDLLFCEWQIFCMKLFNDFLKYG